METVVRKLAASIGTSAINRVVLIDLGDYACDSWTQAHFGVQATSLAGGAQPMLKFSHANGDANLLSNRQHVWDKAVGLWDDDLGELTIMLRPHA